MAAGRRQDCIAMVGKWLRPQAAPMASARCQRVDAITPAAIAASDARSLSTAQLASSCNPRRASRFLTARHPGSVEHPLFSRSRAAIAPTRLPAMQTTAALRTVQLPARSAVRTACSSKRAAVRCAQTAPASLGPGRRWRQGTGRRQWRRSAVQELLALMLCGVGSTRAWLVLCPQEPATAALGDSPLHSKPLLRPAHGQHTPRSPSVNPAGLQAQVLRAAARAAAAAGGSGAAGC